MRAPHDDAEGPREFVQDVLAQLAAAGPAPYADDVLLPWEEDGCGYYHAHETTVKCGGGGKKRKAARRGV